MPAIVVSAPIWLPSAVWRIPFSPAMPPRSITTLGRFTRSLNQSRLSLPPAIFQMSLPRRSSSVRASASLVGCSSSKLGIMSRIMAAFPSLRVGGKRLVGLRALGDGVHDHVRHHWLAVEVMPAHGVRHGARHGLKRELVLADADQPGAGEPGDRGLRDRVEIARRLLAAESAAEVARPLRGGRIGERLRRIGLEKHFLAADVVIIGIA